MNLDQTRQQTAKTGRPPRGLGGMCGSLGERGLQGDGGTVASHDLNPLEFALLRVFLCLIPYGTSLCHNLRAHSEVP